MSEAMQPDRFRWPITKRVLFSSLRWRWPGAVCRGGGDGVEDRLLRQSRGEGSVAAVLDETKFVAADGSP